MIRKDPQMIGGQRKLSDMLKMTLSRMPLPTPYLVTVQNTPQGPPSIHPR